MKWNPSQYILERKYCDLNTLVGELSDIREMHNAEGAILLVWHKKRFFRSLTLCSHEDPSIQSNLNSFLTRIALKLENLDIFELLAASTPGPLRGVISALKTSAAPNEAEFIGELAKLGGILPDEIRIVPIYSPIADNPHVVSIVVLLLQPTHQRSKDVCDPVMRSLHCMVSSFPSVSIYRDFSHRHASDTEVAEGTSSILKRAYPETTDFIERSSSLDLIKSLAEHLLSVAMSATKSDCGRWFTLAREKRGLSAVIVQHMTNNSQDLVIPLAESQTEPQSLFAYAARRGQPFVINESSSFGDRYPHLVLDRVTSTDGRVPAARIVWPILASVPRNDLLLAVVDLHKLTGVYTWEALESLEQILSVYRDLLHEILHGVTANFLRDVTHRTQFGLLRKQEAAQSPRQGTVYHAEKADLALLSMDLSQIMPLIEYALRGLYDLTSSYFVGLRLLSRDTRHLVRLCSCVANVDIRNFLIQVDDAKSVTAWVLREGRPCYIPDYEMENWAAPYPGLVGGHKIHQDGRSSYTVPIFVLGRAIGSLHVDSVYSNAYSNCAALVGAVADAVGAGIWTASRDAEGDTFSRRAWKSGLIHEVRKLSKKLDAIIKTYESSTPGVYRDIAQWSNQLAATVVMFDQPRTEAEPTLVDMIRAIVSELRATRFFNIEVDTLGTINCRSEHARDVRLVLRELFDNALKADDNSRPVIKGSRRRLGGKAYIVISITNSFTQLAADILPKLFQQPIRTSSAADGIVSHYGTISIATIIRNLGGDVYVSQVDYPTKTIQICLEIPTIGGIEI